MKCFFKDYIFFIMLMVKNVFVAVFAILQVCLEHILNHF